MHDPTTTPPVEDAPTRPEFDPAAELAEIRTRIERLERAAALPGSRGVVRQLVAAGVISLG